MHRIADLPSNHRPSHKCSVNPRMQHADAHPIATTTKMTPTLAKMLAQMVDLR